MTHLLLVGAWPELAGELVGLPARVTLFQLPGMKSGQEWVYRFRELDYRQLEDTVEAAADLHARDPIEVVAGFREYALPAIAAIARKLGVRSVPAPAASLERDKASVRELLNAGAARPVPYQLCANSDEVRDFVTGVGLPVILKPPAGAGSLGVHAAFKPEDIPSAFVHALAASSTTEVLAEQLVAGPEFSVETRSVAGHHEILGVTEKITDGPPHFVEHQHVHPARIHACDRELLCTEAVRALTAIGHDTGPSHIELILDADGPVIVEINRRMGGDRVFELVPLATGRNIMRESLLDVLGITHQPALHAERAACIRFLRTDRQRQLPDPLPETEIAEVIRARITAEPGRAVQPAACSADRFGYVVTVASTSDEAATAAETAEKRLMRQLFDR